MLGWIVDPESGNGRPMLLEVKSSADGSFHLSPNEWLCAEEYTDAYGVLIVRRAPTGAVPQRLDLLVDPVGLVPERLSKTADGWLMAYGGIRVVPSVGEERGPTVGRCYPQAESIPTAAGEVLTCQQSAPSP